MPALTAAPRGRNIPAGMDGTEEQVDKKAQLDLARAACAGDADAFGKLFRLLYQRMHRTVWGMMGDESEAHDVTQEAWIKAWKQRNRFNFESAFSTWIHRIAVNTALDALRRRRRIRNRVMRLFDGFSAKPVPETVADPVSQAPDRQLRNKELGEAIEEAVAGLPEEQRTVLVLREYEGYSYGEIARLVGVKTGTVMSRLHHARRKLQTRLSKEMS